MAVFLPDKAPQYAGAVLKIESHYWADGMESEWAVCWNHETQQIERISVGYYGSDGHNLAGGSAEVDASRETWREVIHSWKPDAWRGYADSVTAYKQGIRPGTHAVVVRGNKVKKGTKVTVFWVGERPTFQSRRYSWLNETETVAGCYDETGAKVWIKAEYLKNVDPIKSPSPKERKKWIQDFLTNKARCYGAPWAK